MVKFQTYMIAPVFQKKKLTLSLKKSTKPINKYLPIETNQLISIYHERHLSEGTLIAKVRTHDLIKPFFKPNRLWWSSGIISRIIFTHDILYSQKLSSITNSRKMWGIWAYSITLWWQGAQKQLCHYKPWSLRVRRFFNLTSTNTITSTVTFNANINSTRKRRIKRWLKKKYTTQSWR